MSFNLEGISTGLLGYSLRKEFFSDSIPYREVETFNFEFYSTDISGLSPYNIQTNIYNYFTGIYSGNIDCKIFGIPTEFQFPSDNIRTTKFDVSVEVRRVPSNLTGYTELNTSTYSGLNYSFFSGYSTYLLDFKEDFTFDQNENGHQSFNHTVSFGLITGGKTAAMQIISGIFGNDFRTPFGLSVFISGISGANPANVQNYYTESYDLIKNSYSFNKKRDFYPSDATTFTYNLIHSMSLQANGVFDITEKCDLQGKVSFLQATQGLNLLYNNSISRCTDFYNMYNSAIAQPGEPNSIAPLSITPRKYVQTYNIPSLSASYEITYTNDPEFQNGGDSEEEIIELNVDEKNIVTITDKYTFTFNKRNLNFQGAYALLTGAFTTSPSAISGYYAQSCFYQPSWPINMIKMDITWPYNKHQSTIDLSYSNNPRFDVTINNVLFKSLDYTITNLVPVDIVQEYKIINRPNKLSVLNYAYQSEKGAITVNINAGIGRQTNEFVTGFRTDIATYLLALYQYSITLFWQQFSNVLPISFTYFLSDIKYNMNNDGSLNMNVQFTYTYKKYLA
jgi:hypothetical protein